jgi:hypothetical protein
MGGKKGKAAIAIVVSMLAACVAFAGCVGDQGNGGVVNPDGGGGGDSSPNSTGADGQAGGNDGGTAGSDGASADAGGGPPCDVTKPFGMPTAAPFVSINTLSREEDPYLLPDELTLYFSSNRAFGDGCVTFALYRATRSTITAPFDPATPVPGAVNIACAEAHGAVVSTDELTMYFTKAQAGVTNGYEIWSSVRGTAAAAWPAAAQVAGVNSISPDHLTGAGYLLQGDLWFHVSESNFTSNVIYRAPKSGNAFGTPIAINELGAHASIPKLTADGLRIFYTQGPPDDIWTAVRATTADAFSQAQAVSSVNSSGDDNPGWISPDGCRMYLYSDRSGGAGSFDLYVAERPQ